MTRFHLNAQGQPIPTEALPDGLSETGMPPITLTYNADDSFDKTVWESFGYQFFTVMCVGAAGGRASRALYMRGAGTNAPNMHTTCGGAGGGGGLHIVSGLLADLDDILAIIVGQAGVERGLVQPGYSLWPVSYNDHNIDVGLDGGDGGYSSFGGDVCMASGGKGGKASPITFSGLVGSSWRPGGAGGDGGKGGRTAAGGGAAGALAVLNGLTWHNVAFNQEVPIYTSPQGEQGFWDGEIGEGGGGGLGFSAGGFGAGSDAAWITELPTAAWAFQSVHSEPGREVGPTDGGRGSFSYADSSKHGAKGPKPSVAYRTDFNPYQIRNINFVLPGCGGGARPTPLAKYGSYAEGYSPNGVVIVKVT